MRTHSIQTKAVLLLLTLTFFSSCFTPYIAHAEDTERLANESAPICCGGANNAPTGYDAARERLATEFRYLRKARDKMDTSMIEPDALAKEIGPKVADLFGFVRDTIAYQAYHGALRTAQGALLTGAGNGYDQSMLLASILQHHGHKIRYAFGQLPDTQVRILSKAVTLPPIRQTLSETEIQNPFPTLRSDDEIKHSIQIRDAVTTLSHAQHQIDFADTFLLIRKHLPTLGADTHKQATHSLLPAIKRHCWIEVDVNGHWTALDPSFAKATVGQSFATSTHTKPSLQANEDGYVLAFTLIAEQTQGETVKRHTVLEQEAPLTKTLNHIAFMAAPANADLWATGEKDGASLLAQATVFAPLLWINGQKVQGTSFDLDGNTVAEDGRIQNANKARKATGNAFNKGIGALDGLFGGTPATPIAKEELTALTMTLVLRGPQGVVHTIHRTLARRAATGDQALENFKVALLSPLSMLSSGAEIPADYAALDTLDRAIENRQMYQAMLALRYDQPAPPNFREQVNHRSTRFPADILDYMTRRSATLNWHRQTRPHTAAAYFGTPQITASKHIFEKRPEKKIAMIQQFDVMFNRLSSPEENTQSARFAIEQGVLDTLEEKDFIADNQHVTTHSIMKAAQSSNIKTLLLTPADTSKLTALTLDAASKDVMMRDLKSGFSIIAPIQAVNINGTDRFGWWRINTQSGETLGMLSSGHGGDAAEYSLIQNAIVNASVSAILCFLLYLTGNVPDGVEFAKCVAVGFALGTGVGHFTAGSKGLGLLINVLLCVGIAINRNTGHGTPGGPKGRLMNGEGTLGDTASDLASCLVIAGAGMALGVAGNSLGNRARSAWAASRGAAGASAGGARGGASTGRSGNTSGRSGSASEAPPAPPLPNGQPALRPTGNPSPQNGSPFAPASTGARPAAPPAPPLAPRPTAPTASRAPALAETPPPSATQNAVTQGQEAIRAGAKASTAEQVRSAVNSLLNAAANAGR